MGLRGILRKPLGLDKKPRVVYRDRPARPQAVSQPRQPQTQFTRAYRGGNVISINVGQPSAAPQYRTYNPDGPQKARHAHRERKKGMMARIAHGLKTGVKEGAKAYRAEAQHRRAGTPQRAGPFGGRPSWMNEQGGNAPNWTRERKK